MKLCWSRMSFKIPDWNFGSFSCHQRNNSLFFWKNDINLEKVPKVPGLGPMNPDDQSYIQTYHTWSYRSCCKMHQEKWLLYQSPNQIPFHAWFFHKGLFFQQRNPQKLQLKLLKLQKRSFANLWIFNCWYLSPHLRCKYFFTLVIKVHDNL